MPRNRSQSSAARKIAAARETKPDPIAVTIAGIAERLTLAATAARRHDAAGCETAWQEAKAELATLDRLIGDVLMTYDD